MRDLKQQLTHDLVKKLDVDLGITDKIAMKTWWHNIRPDGGMRLTDKGYQILNQMLKLPQYKIELTGINKINNSVLLDLDRKIQNPYYIMAKHTVPYRLVLFGDKEAMLITLYGDLIKFLNNYSVDSVQKTS